MFQVIVELEGEQLGRVRGEVRDRHVKTGKENRRQTVKRVQSNFVSVLVMPGSTLAGLKVDYMIQLTRKEPRVELRVGLCGAGRGLG